MDTIISCNITSLVLLERKFLAQSIKQPINQSFKSTVEGTRILLAIGPAVYPLRAEQVVGVTPTDSIGTRYAC